MKLKFLRDTESSDIDLGPSRLNRLELGQDVGLE